MRSRGCGPFEGLLHTPSTGIQEKKDPPRHHPVFHCIVDSVLGGLQKLLPVLTVVYWVVVPGRDNIGHYVAEPDVLRKISRQRGTGGPPCQVLASDSCACGCLGVRRTQRCYPHCMDEEFTLTPVWWRPSKVRETSDWWRQRSRVGLDTLLLKLAVSLFLSF